MDEVMGEFARRRATVQEARRAVAALRETASAYVVSGCDCRLRDFERWLANEEARAEAAISQVADIQTRMGLAEAARSAR